MDTLTTYTLDTGLAGLPPHLPMLLASLAFFMFVHLFVAPLTSHAFFPDTYGKMGRRARNKWCIHVVLQAHILPGCLNLEALDRDCSFGWDEDRVGG
ncbi:hypothetical protein IW262DRAFT_641557 [Armillaria fumosa]|nr:hypothetical protein IW262DRAFT_641557 [Armillaria fumosa]